MRTALAAILAGSLALASPAWGDEPAGAAQVILRGQAAPDDGVFLTTASAADLAGRCKASAVEAAALRTALAERPTGWSGATLLVVGVLALAAGVLLGSQLR